MRQIPFQRVRTSPASIQLTEAVWARLPRYDDSTHEVAGCLAVRYAQLRDRHGVGLDMKALSVWNRAGLGRLGQDVGLLVRAPRLRRDTCTVYRAPTVEQGDVGLMKRHATREHDL